MCRIAHFPARPSPAPALQTSCAVVDSTENNNPLKHLVLTEFNLADSDGNGWLSSCELQALAQATFNEQQHILSAPILLLFSKSKTCHYLPGTPGFLDGGAPPGAVRVAFSHIYDAEDACEALGRTCGGLTQVRASGPSYQLRTSTRVLASSKGEISYVKRCVSEWSKRTSLEDLVEAYLYFGQDAAMAAARADARRAEAFVFPECTDAHLQNIAVRGASLSPFPRIPSSSSSLYVASGLGHAFVNTETMQFAVAGSFPTLVISRANQDNTDVITAREGTGNYFFALRISHGVYFQVGWASAGLFQWSKDRFSVHAKPAIFSPTQGTGVGDAAKTWAYDGMRALAWSSGVDAEYGEVWQVGDIIGCSLDTNRHVMGFYRNGRFLGNAFTDVDLTSHGVLPAISAEGLDASQGQIIIEPRDPGDASLLPPGHIWFGQVRKNHQHSVHVDKPPAGPLCPRVAGASHDSRAAELVSRMFTRYDLNRDDILDRMEMAKLYAATAPFGAIFQANKNMGTAPSYKDTIVLADPTLPLGGSSVVRKLLERLQCKYHVINGYLEEYPAGIKNTHFRTRDAALRACSAVPTCAGVTHTPQRRYPYSLRGSNKSSKSRVKNASAGEKDLGGAASRETSYIRDCVIKEWKYGYTRRELMKGYAAKASRDRDDSSCGFQRVSQVKSDWVAIHDTVVALRVGQNNNNNAQSPRRVVFARVRPGLRFRLLATVRPVWIPTGLSL